MGKKRQINTTQIYETSVRLDAAVMSGGTNDASEWVDDVSTELFADCNTLLDEGSADIHTTVENLNNYLNSVAAEFEKADSKMAKLISANNGLESIPMENKKAAEKEKIRSNDYYNELKKSK